MTTTSKADAPARREEYRRLRASGLTIDQAADRLKVTRRTADRYERWRRGGPGTYRPAGWTRDPILAHMRRYPHLVFSAIDLARVVAGSDRARGQAITGITLLLNEGLIEVVMERSGQQLVRRYCLAAAQLRQAA
ncbi:hypothetical protein GT755_12230 [Herbidospora sp. NEAU-GS84]|uniref:Uncharacterized protein n=1 Tax=Herbidospora solisilvae TaxID=2696284 RepID=A0A7C9N0S2_9ACTN|nr:hypothetical protein [Herbidospora solisilvae]NAS22449.1 hypothetical protein [Herbidospora solisilvae]